MFPLQILKDSLLRAETWLSAQHKDNVYLRYSRYTGAAVNPSQSTFSYEITGYAAHYWAWRFMATSQPDFRHKTLCKGAADAIVRAWREANKWLPFEPGSDLQYFFDCGIAARGLQAAARCMQNTLYLDIATQITAAMRGMEFPSEPGQFRPIRAIRWQPLTSDWPDPDALVKPGDHATIWWSRGPFLYQRKAALAFRLADDKSSFDRLDLYTARLGFGDFNPPVPTIDELPAEKFEAENKARKKGKALLEKRGDGYVRAAWAVELDRADYNHPLAYNLEASAMSGIHQARAEEELIELEARMKGTPFIRSDSYAQLLRVKMYLASGSIPFELFDRLVQMQHSSGGFKFSEALETYRPVDVSVHATMFACQAMAMAILYNERGLKEQTAPFGRRELAIV